MKNYFFLLLILFMIIIAGCTQEEEQNPPVTTPVLKSKGLNIINFTSNFDTIRIQESTNIYAKIKNAGDFEALNVTAVLYGYGLIEKQT